MARRNFSRNRLTHLLAEGYGQTGPYKGAAGYDVVIEGEGTLMRAPGFHGYSLPIHSGTDAHVTNATRCTFRRSQLIDLFCIAPVNPMALHARFALILVK